MEFYLRIFVNVTLKGIRVNYSIVDRVACRNLKRGKCFTAEADEGNGICLFSRIGEGMQ